MSSKKVHAQLIFMNYPHTHSDHSYTLNIEPHKEDTSYSINVGTEVSWTLLCMHVRLQSQLYNYNDLQVVCSIGQAVCTRADIQVRIDDKQLRGLYCCTCKYNKQHCSHVDIVEKALNSPDEDKHDCLNKIAKDMSIVCSRIDKCTCISIGPFHQAVYRSIYQVNCLNNWHVL